MRISGIPGILFLLFFLFALGSGLWAQEESSPKTDMTSELEDEFEEEEEEEEESRHFFSIMIAHDHVSQGIKNGDRTWLNLPSFMLAYNYMITERFAVGLAGDIIVEQFDVEANNLDEILERSYPIALVATGTYRVFNHLGILAGGGFEYAKEATFGMVRFGLEPYIVISSHLELVFNLSYDIKIDAYDNWNMGFGVAIGL